MNDESYPKPATAEIHIEEIDPWSERVKNLAINQGKFNPDTDIHSLESHDKDGTHYVIGYRPHTKLPIEPECLAVSTGRNSDGSKKQHRFVWDESEGPEHLYASQLDEIDRIIKAFEKPKEVDG